ncbi:AraC-like DNA-binding protein [Friedmanniella endophytica]|uniref:AraC-like DNA-binding protein n=1 Tax=Microlunatus kandeliicorticis TaxID=1759536 RepID=A0A7W3ITS6_9ACTN|nr:helix-turn-helix transcriptional regulator [Microlunatus kandeliicorticis]MBA8795063.1 AraC-like DNA-binding protein [Microlunatus kandeliicorticis]
MTLFPPDQAPTPSTRPLVRSRTGVLTADYQPGATFGRRRLSDHEFVWLTHGSARWEVETLGGERQVHELRPGRLSLGFPGQWDRFFWAADRPTRHRYAHFRVPTPGFDAPRGAQVRSFDELPLLGALCEHLGELTIRTGGTDLQERAALARRVDELLAVLVMVFVGEPALHPAGGDDRTADDPLTAVWDAVAAAWAQDGPSIVGVDRLAEAAGISRGHVFRLFRQRFGVGPAEALELVRLSRAATALQRSNTPLAAIAAATGFADPYHFSHRFSRVYGCPPGEYRRRGEDTDPASPLRGPGLLGVAARLG